MWLLQRFDRIIKLWCWRWISLGGILTLAHFALVNMAVYWFSLSKVPKSIINQIQKKIMVFIWFGDNVQSKYHLVRWENIAGPVEKGGWGLKNMHLFSMALRAKSLWLVFFGGSLWSLVLKEKYFRKISTIQWVGSYKKPGRHISNVWAGLLGAFKLFSSWLAWTPGDG